MQEGFDSERKLYHEQRRIPVAYNVDVIVAGGGIAGFGAAWGAAKAGARVLLLDCNNAPGGVTAFHGNQGLTKMFYGGPDGRTLVMRGVLKEMVERYVAAEGGHWDWDAYADYWADGWTWWCYDAELLKLVLTEMLHEAGVKMLFNTWVTRGIAEDGAARGVVYETKEGARVALARCIVDSTGDALVSQTMGVPMQALPEPNVFVSTFLFRVGNVDFQKLFDHLMAHPEDIGNYAECSAGDLQRRKERLRREWEMFGFFSLPDIAGSTLKSFLSKAMAAGRYKAEHLGVIMLDRMGIEGCRQTGICTVNTGLQVPHSLDAAELSDLQINGRRICYYVLNELLRPYIPGFERATIVATTPDLGIRTSRKIKAERFLAKSDLGRKFADVVAVFNPYRTIEENHTLVAEIPYGALVPVGVENLLVASGRSFPSEGNMAHPYREAPATLLIGQAAGAAAALSARTATPPRKLSRETIQQQLIMQDVYLGDEQRLKELGLDRFAPQSS